MLQIGAFKMSTEIRYPPLAYSKLKSSPLSVYQPVSYEKSSSNRISGMLVGVLVRVGIAGSVGVSVFVGVVVCVSVGRRGLVRDGANVGGGVGVSGGAIWVSWAMMVWAAAV